MFSADIWDTFFLLDNSFFFAKKRILRFRGTLVGGRPNGFGVYEWNEEGSPSQGDKYQGEYKDGKRHGKGG